MKTAVVYYSFTGKTKELAEKKAQQEEADLIGIREIKERSTLSAFTAGAFLSMRRKAVPIQTIKADLGIYDKIIVAVPLWAGCPAAPFNSILEKIPSGKKIEMIVTSGSGDSSKGKDKTLRLASSKGIEIISYEDIKTTM